MSRKSLLKALLVGIMLPVCMVAMLFLAQTSLGKAELTPANYLEFLRWDSAFKVSQTIKLPTPMAKYEEMKDMKPAMSASGILMGRAEKARWSGRSARWDLTTAGLCSTTVMGSE